jgi:hypothetical protein
MFINFVPARTNREEVHATDVENERSLPESIAYSQVKTQRQRGPRYWKETMELFILLL